MKIALDVEGTIANPHLFFLEWYNKENNTNYTLNDITKWGYPQKNFNMSIEYFHEIIDKTWREKWDKIPLTEDYLATNIALLYQFNTLDIVTCRVSCEDEIKKFLEKRIIKYDNFVGVEGSTTNKVKLDYNIFIDDSPKLAEKANIFKKPVLLYDRPWNQKIKDTTYIKRVHNFNEITATLKIP
ncbi:hypothetical protein GF374_01665 [Candidatus Woesearchaeota archaeon]|nr:hypothetical protein [Candidatus Woesearchaeota archaeon]